MKIQIPQKLGLTQHISVLYFFCNFELSLHFSANSEN